MTDYTELKRLANYAIGLDDSAYIPCQVAFQRAANPAAVLALIAENEALKGPHDWLAEDLIKELVDNAQSFQENSCEEGEDPFVIVLLAAASRIRRQEANLDQLKAENEALRNALMECTNSLQGEMLQKFGGQLPEDMHPVTRREYDRDIAEVSGYRAAIGQGEQS